MYDAALTATAKNVDKRRDQSRPDFDFVDHEELVGVGKTSTREGLGASFCMKATGDSGGILAVAKVHGIGDNGA